MDRHTVSVATGAMGPVIEKLTALLVQEKYMSHLGPACRRDIDLIKSKLASLHSLLRGIWEREDLGAECKKWMVDARELSYDMEDDIDDFMLGLELSNGSGHGHSSLKSLFRKFKIRVVDVSRRCRDEWKIASTETISNLSKRSIDPRAGFLHKDASELVGMGKPKERLLQLLQEHQMVCIHGFAGLGKTTLADMVYHEIGHEFQCRAFVSLSRRPDMLEVLRAILSQVSNGAKFAAYPSTEAATEQNLVNDISSFLSDKRYLVIVDDIWDWEEWEIISKALGKGKPMCRIIITTRVSAIAVKCRLTKEGASIYRHNGIDYWDAFTLSLAVMKKINAQTLQSVMFDAMEELAPKIAEMCCGMPLAVTCLSSAVMARLLAGAQPADLQRRLWQMVLDGLLRRADPFFGPLVKSLSISYDDLGDELKTCLLYCTSIYPSGYEIQRHRLVRKWMHEGFVKDLEAGEAYLDILVSRGLLQPAEDVFVSVHPMMRAFLVCKLEAANDFVTIWPGSGGRSHAGRIRRLSVGSQLENIADSIIASTMIKEGDVSHTRSLVVVTYPWPHTGWCLLPWKQLQRLRVLSLETCGVPLRDTDLVDICTGLLRRLRYLGLKGTPICALPRQIGGSLQNLETLDVSNTSVRDLPIETGKLHHLKILDVSNTSVWKLPRQIGKLQHLKTVDVTNTAVRELPWQFSSSVSVLVGDKSVKLSDGVLAVLQHYYTNKGSTSASSSLVKPGEDLSLLLYDHLGNLLPAAGHKVGSRHMRVPECVRQHLDNVSSLDIRLCQLEDDDLNFLCNKMPYLQLLTMRLEVLPTRKPIVIKGEGFSMLKSFFLDCRLPVVTFQKGAMPKLEHLEFKFYTSRALTIEDHVGIRHLLSLKRVVFQSSPRYKSNAPGISVLINKVREEAKEHPNKITISINGKDEEVIQEKEATKTTSASGMISEENVVTSGGAGGSSGASMIKTSIPSPYDNGSDDEKGSIIPVKSYYPFGVAK